MPEEKYSMDHILNCVGIILKWQRYRDAVYKLFTVMEREVNGKKDETKYNERIKMLQLLIKAETERTKSDNHVHAITKLAGDDHQEATLSVQFLAAGYELLSGKDFTK